MRIVVCVKQVVDTEAEKKLVAPDWRIDRTVENILNPYDEYAVEAAIQLKEASDAEVIALCVGSEAAEDAVRKALAMGADEAVLVTDDALAGSDALGTARVLAAAIKPAGGRPGALRGDVHRRADGPGRAGTGRAPRAPGVHDGLAPRGRRRHC